MAYKMKYLVVFNGNGKYSVFESDIVCVKDKPILLGVTKAEANDFIRKEIKKGEAK